MKVYVYSLGSSQSNMKKIQIIKEELLKIYKSIVMTSYDEFINIDLSSVEVLMFSGGDGVFNNIINKCVGYSHIVFGYIPLGTANDIAHNMGISNYKMALDVIRKGVIKKYDLISVNERYFFYALSVGCLSAVSTSSHKISKKVFHKVVYKFRGIRYMFRPKSEIIIEVNGNKMHQRLKVLLVVRSKYLGGVKINDEITNNLKVICVRSIFNLFQIFVLKKYKAITTKELYVYSQCKWCCDGEGLKEDSAVIKISDQSIKMYS